MNSKINLPALGCMCLLLIFTPAALSGQPAETEAAYDSLYWKGLDEVSRGKISVAKEIQQMLLSFKQLPSPIRKAKADYLLLRIIQSDPEQVKALEEKTFTPPDSLGYEDALIYRARKYLEKSMSDQAVPLLMEAIDSLKGNPDRVIYCRILLTDAYRQMHEFAKGIDMLRGILFQTKKLSAENRAFACNRLAALYNEWGNPKPGYRDSVIKYAELSMALSATTGNRSTLATAQNELGFQYLGKKMYDKALDLSGKAVENFIAAGMTYDAMNTLLNRSITYTGLKQYEQGLKELSEATELCPIWENRNLFMRIYMQFSRIYGYTGDYKEAWEFLAIGRRLQEESFKESLNSKIYELTAKYDLLVKEQKIKEEHQKSEFYRKQKVILVISLILLGIAFMTTVFYLRFRRKAFLKQQLIEAVVRTEADERKRLARDLHDGLGPVLSAINHYFQAYIDAGGAEKETIGNKMQQIILGAIREVSRISHNISPHVLENHGLVTALENFIDPLENSHKIKVDFTCGLNQRFDHNKELTVYRCITELFSNTLKYADATGIELHISCESKMISVHYSDNGKGFEPDAVRKDGMGLFNIRNRVETYGGKLDIQSSPGMGMQVYFEIPL